MNIVDSCGWLEYFSLGSNADFFREPIMDLESLIVPSISVYEVFKRVLVQRGESSALEAAAFMQQGTMVNLTGTIAMNAARLSVDKKLPMADSIMLASAREFGAVLWTQDADFAGLEGVRYFQA